LGQGPQRPQRPQELPEPQGPQGPQGPPQGPEQLRLALSGLQAAELFGESARALWVLGAGATLAAHKVEAALVFAALAGAVSWVRVLLGQAWRAH